jgi:hypothetical protein
MKKWMTLLAAGILMSAVMIGCKKEEETNVTNPPATTGTTGAGAATAGETTGAPAPATTGTPAPATTGETGH